MKDKLYNFLIEAKKQTYAKENVKKQISSRKGSHDYEYKYTFDVSGNLDYFEEEESIYKKVSHNNDT